MNKVVKKKVSRGWEGKSERHRAFFQAAYSVFGLTIDSIIATSFFPFKEAFDAIIIDLCLLNLSGVGLCREVRYYLRDIKSV